MLNKKSRRSVLQGIAGLSLLGLLGGLLGGTPADAQKSKTMLKTRATKGASRGASEIKDPDKKGDPKQLKIDKGSAKSRGSYPVVEFDNWTYNTIDCYIDGYYKGTAGPMGELYCYTTHGNHRLFATTGDLNFGPAIQYVGSSGFIWQLTD